MRISQKYKKSITFFISRNINVDNRNVFYYTSKMIQEDDQLLENSLNDIFNDPNLLKSSLSRLTKHFDDQEKYGGFFQKLKINNKNMTENKIVTELNDTNKDDLSAPERNHPMLPLSPEEKANQLADKLNEDVANIHGEWVFSTEYDSIVWYPAKQDSLNVNEHRPTEVPESIKGLVEWGKQIDFDSLKDNSVVLIKLNTDDPIRTQTMQMIIARKVLEPRIELLKEKKICILFMGPDDDISVMDESEMLQAGWNKVDKKRIITLS